MVSIFVQTLISCYLSFVAASVSTSPKLPEDTRNRVPSKRIKLLSEICFNRHFNDLALLSLAFLSTSS